MQIKKGARLEQEGRERARFEIGYACGIVERCYELYWPKLPVFTSFTDGKHSANSLHYKGLAVDVRTHDVKPAVHASIFKELLARLEPLGFDVINETDHFHIEFDPKFGEQLLRVVE